MCKTPKVKTPTEKKPQYLRNPLLDGLQIGGQNTGRNSLRIDLTGSVPASLQPTQPIFTIPTPVTPGARSGLAVPATRRLRTLTR